MRTYRPSNDKTIQSADTTILQQPSVTSVKQSRTTRSGYLARYLDIPRSIPAMPRTYLFIVSEGGPQA